MEHQAKFDLGRFMPHPRCSQVFRDITCTSMIGGILYLCQQLKLNFVFLINEFNLNT